MTAHDTNEPRGQSQGQPRNQRRGRDDAVDRTILTLIRAGTRRCRFVAAFMAITLSLVSQSAGVAYAEAAQTVLYLDAPTVSDERATQAGEVASEYSKVGSPATDETLAWLAVPEGAQEPVDPPEEAREAFASVTAPSDGPGVTAGAALVAGETMLAQLEGAEDGGAGELAAAEAVRPHLGDGSADGEGGGERGATQDTQEDEPRYEAEAAPPATQPAAGDPGATPQPQYEPPELASLEAASGEEGGGEAPVTEPEKEPSGAGLVVARSSPEPEPPEVGGPQAGERVELASAPSAFPGEAQGREESSPTGPITDTGPAPLLAEDSQEDPEGAAAGEPASEPTETQPEAEQTPSLASEPGVAPPEASPAEEAAPVEEVPVEEVPVEAAPAEETLVEAAPVEEAPTEYAQSSPDSITAQPEVQPEAGQTPPPPSADTGPTGGEGSAGVAIVPTPTPEVVSEGPGSQPAEQSEEFESPGSARPPYEEQPPTPPSSGEHAFGEGEDSGSEETRAQPETARPEESIQEFEIVAGGAERGEESSPDDPSESPDSLEEAAPVPGDEDDGDGGGNGGDFAEGEEARNPTAEPPAPVVTPERPAEDATPEDDPLPTPVEEEGEGADEGGGATAEAPPNAEEPGGPAGEQLRDEREAQRKEEREAVVEEQPVIEAVVPQPTRQEEIASGSRDEYRAMRREERQARQEAAAIERERRAAGEEAAHEVGQDMAIEQNGGERVAIQQQQSVDEQQLLEQQAVEQQAAEQEAGIVAEQVVWQEEAAAADREARKAVHQAEREWQVVAAEQATVDQQAAVDQAAMEEQVWRQAAVEEQQIAEERRAIEQIAAQQQAAEQAAVEEQLAAEQAAAEQAALDAAAVEQAAMVAEQRAYDQQVAEQHAAVDWAAAERQAVAEQNAVEQQDAYESQADPADAGMQSGYAQPATTDVPQPVPQQIQQAQPADYTTAVDTTVVAQPQAQPQVGQTTTQAQPVAAPPVENTAVGAGGGQPAVTESQQISESASNVTMEVSQ